MMTRAYPGKAGSKLGTQIAKKYFLPAIDDRDLELRIRESEPQDLDSAFKHAVRLEALAKAVDRTADREIGKRD